ncbi:hypothetical protein I3760_01G253600 [Carya illinoinensis]|nr:hypothetical protein I3760_01G253600 [Carya illinoinensis]
MFPTRDIPSPSSLFLAYASMAASMMLVRSMANEIIPQPVRGFLLSTLRYYFKPHSPRLTLVIEENCGMSRNQVYDAIEVYLCTKIRPNTERLKISKSPKEKNLMIRLEKGERLIDFYDGVELNWRIVCAEAKAIKDEERVLKMYTLNGSYAFHGVKWESINLEHPDTFETLAMDPELKHSVMEDLNRFVKRKEFYKRVGRTWKRGYLLYGPPG